MLALCLTVGVLAQAPKKMSYQAVIRNNRNVLIASTAVNMRISILRGSGADIAVYVETQSAITNANGLVSLQIGTGAAVVGTFSNIDWANGPYYIKTETDPVIDDCNCSDRDAKDLANQVVNDFTRSQNDLPSEYARIMNIESVEKRGNCTWLASFRISWPFGNTDGAHPDEFMRKRFACDGKEIYEQ